MYVSHAWRVSFVSTEPSFKRKKPCQNINIEYAAILPFHDFNVRGQTKVSNINFAIKHHLSSVPPDLYLKLNELCMNLYKGYAVILPFHDFSEVKQMWHMYRYVLTRAYTLSMFNTLIDKIYSSKHISKCRV